MRFLKGVGALLLLVAAVVGLPYALAVFGGNPFPGGFSWAAVQRALLTPDTGQVLVGLVTIIGWVAWAVFTTSVVAELVTVLSKQRIRIRLPGLHATQRVAGTLVVLIIAMLAVTPEPPTAAAHPTTTPTPVPHRQIQTVDQPTAQTPANQPVTPTGRGAGEPAAGSAAPKGAVAVQAMSSPSRAPSAGGSGQAGPVTHTVRSGDLLWELAEKYYDHGPSWTRIAKANDLSDPDHLRVGQKLVIPGAKQQHEQPAGDTVTVERGDTLSSIAEEQLGDASDWPNLYRANRDQISNPDLIDVGQVLTITDQASPARPSQPRPEERDQPRPREPQTPTDNERPLDPSQSPRAEPSADQPSTTMQPTTAPPATTAPRNEAPASTAPPTNAANPSSESEADDSAAEQFAAPAALAGVGLLLTAGLVTTLHRRRQRQLTRRRPGRRIPAAPRRAMPVETAMRQQTEPLTITALDQALRAIGAHCHTHDTAPPRLSAARISDTRLDLLLTEAATSAPAGVTVADNGLAWTIHAERLSALLATPGQDSGSHPWPALVTLGRDADNAHILIDLEAAGSLSVQADTSEQATAAITGLVLELAVSPWAMDIRLTLVGDQLCPGLPAALDNPLVRHVDGLDQLLDELDERAEDQRPHLLASATGVGQKRVDPDLADAWSPEIVFVDTQLIDAQADRLAELVTSMPRVAIATVTTQPTADRAWRLHVNGEPAVAHLDPHGWDLTAQLVPTTLYGQVLDLITTTGRDDTLPAPWWNHLTAEADTEADRPAATITHLHPATSDEADHQYQDQDQDGGDDAATDMEADAALERVAPGNGLVEGTTTSATRPRQTLGGSLIDRLPPHEEQQVPSPPSADPADEDEEADAVVLPMHPTLRILGPVELLGAAGTRNRVPKRCMEYLGYLLEHPGSSAARIAAAFSVEHETVRTTISYLRKWLGSDPEGTPYLPDAYTGGYALDGRVTSDWARLQLLIGTGVNTTPTANLRQALELVRDRPFADAADQDWAWDTLRTDIQSVIADIAHELTTRSLDKNDLRTARWAASRGLLVDPAAELLLADRVRTETKAGDGDEVDRLITRITSHARRQGTDLLDDTVNVLQQAVQGRR